MRITYGADHVRDMIRAEVARIQKKTGKARGGQTILAKKCGVSRAFLNDVLLGGREPTARILEYFKLERFVVYATKDTFKRG